MAIDPLVRSISSLACASSSSGFSARTWPTRRVSRARCAGSVARLGALPQRLLGAKGPLRAFVAHVEPPFDWTLSAPTTGQHLTGPLVEAVNPNLFSRQPLGMALEDYHAAWAFSTACSQRNRPSRRRGTRGRDLLQAHCQRPREPRDSRRPDGMIPPLGVTHAVGVNHTQ